MVPLNANVEIYQIKPLIWNLKLMKHIKTNFTHLYTESNDFQHSFYTEHSSESHVYVL